MKKWNQKSKAEQIFLLCLLFVFAFGLLCVTGCDGCNCETVKCGSEHWEGGSAAGISIPGCGGCLSYKKGCNSCLWAQSVKLMCVTDKEYHEGYEETYSYSSCDTRYYDGGDCAGCNQNERKNCYSACMKGQVDSEDGSEDELDVGCIYGACDGSGIFIGCVDGCFGCVEHYPSEMFFYEDKIGID